MKLNLKAWLRGFILLVLILVLYFAVGVFDHTIWSPTEPAVSGVVWHMFTHGDLAAPRINGFPYFEKPPFYYWFAWLCARMAGHLSPGLLRLPAALCGAAALALLYVTLRRRFQGLTAAIAVLVGATTLVLFELSHRASSDIAALFFCFGAFAIFYSTLRDEPRRFYGQDILLAVVLALSFYAKNFYTFLIMVPPVFVYLLLRREFRRLLIFLGMLAGFTVLCLTPWCWGLYRSGGWDYLRVVFVDNTLGRFLPLDPTHAASIGPLNDAYVVEKGRPLWYYIEVFFYITLPWIPLYLLGLVELFRRHEKSAFLLFTRVALVTIPVVLSLSSAKALEYLTPLLFILLVAFAGWVDVVVRRTRDIQVWERCLLIINQVVIVVILVGAFPVLGAIQTRWELATNALPVLFLFVLIAWKCRRRWVEGEPLFHFFSLVAAAFFFGAMFLNPYLEQKKSYAFFFAEARERLQPHEQLYSTYRDDRRLPLLNFYFNRDVRTVGSVDEAVSVFRQSEDVAIILPIDLYTENELKFEVVPHTAFTTNKGKQVFMLVQRKPVLR